MFNLDSSSGKRRV